MAGKLKRVEQRGAARIEPRRQQIKRTEAIYGTYQWKEARTLAIALAAYRCRRCEARPRRLFVDHIIELADGGAAYDQGNLQVLCGSCHTTKTIEARNRRLARGPSGQS